MESPKKEKSREKNAEIDFPGRGDLKIENDLRSCFRGCAMTWCAQRDWEWGVNIYLFTRGTQSNSYIHVNEKHCNAMGEYDMLSLTS